MSTRGFVHVWCFTQFVLVPIFAGYALYSVVKNQNYDWIKHRQPWAYFLWILIMSLTEISYTVILWAVVGNSPNLNNLFHGLLITTVGLFLSLAAYFHRTWMCVYKSLLQKSLGELDMWDCEAICKLRSSKSLSNFWVKHRNTLGNSFVMSVVWFSIWLLAGCLELWYSHDIHYNPDSHHLAGWEIVNIAYMSCTIGFALLILAVQWVFTVPDNFNIRTELTMKCFVMTFFITFSEITWNTNFPVHTMLDDMILFLSVITGELFLQLLIMDFYLYMNSRSCGALRGNTINMRTVLKDEDLFLKFEEQQKREFNLENLNFLVSCVQYRRAAMLQGQFGIGSITDCESDIEILNWRDMSAEEDLDPNKIARFIYSEFCVQRAPQNIELDEQTSEKLSRRMKNLSNICNYAERDLFNEAFYLIYDRLDKESMHRFKRALASPRGIHLHKVVSDVQGLHIPLLPKL